MNIQVVSFDADGTVVKERYVNRFWFEELPKLYAKKNRTSFSEAKALLKGCYDEIGDRDLRWYSPGYWFERFGLKEDPSEVIKNITLKEPLIYPDALEALNQLHDRYQLIIISNAPRIFLDFALESIDDYFSQIYSCVSDFKQVKKDSSVYSKIAGLVGVREKEMVHVGDHWEFDYQVPQGNGITTFFVDRNRDHKYEEREILHDLTDLPDRLEDLERRERSL